MPSVLQPKAQWQGTAAHSLLPVLYSMTATVWGLGECVEDGAGERGQPLGVHSRAFNSLKNLTKSEEEEECST